MQIQADQWDKLKKYILTDYTNLLNSKCTNIIIISFIIENQDKCQMHN